MIGYVAKDYDGTIWFHKTYPEYNRASKGWISGIDTFEIPRDEYPEFQSIVKPVKVSLNIKIIAND